MITLETVNSLIDNYDEVLSVAKLHGYTNLKFYYSGMEDDDTLTILATYQNCDPGYLFKDINEALSELLGTKVLLASEDSDMISESAKKQAENAPLADMAKTINYFFDLLIPASTSSEPTDEQRASALKKWETRAKVAPSLSSGNSSVSNKESSQLTLQNQAPAAASLDRLISSSSPIFSQTSAKESAQLDKKQSGSPKRKIIEQMPPLPLKDTLAMLSTHLKNPGFASSLAEFLESEENIIKEFEEQIGKAKAILEQNKKTRSSETTRGQVMAT